MFTSMGIPCVLCELKGLMTNSHTTDDFNKPSERGTDEPTHKILQRWVRDYFVGIHVAKSPSDIPG
jgi:hypothetical protein